jgi:hypothetical protein
MPVRRGADQDFGVIIKATTVLRTVSRTATMNGKTVANTLIYKFMANVKMV